MDGTLCCPRCLLGPVQVEVPLRCLPMDCPLNAFASLHARDPLQFFHFFSSSSLSLSSKSIGLAASGARPGLQWRRAWTRGQGTISVASSTLGSTVLATTTRHTPVKLLQTSFRVKLLQTCFQIKLLQTCFRCKGDGFRALALATAIDCAGTFSALAS